MPHNAFGHGYAAETAHRRENNHSNAENGQANKIRIPCHGFKQLRAAYELGNHSCREEQHDNQSRSIRQRIAAEAGTITSITVTAPSLRETSAIFLPIMP